MSVSISGGRSDALSDVLATIRARAEAATEGPWERSFARSIESNPGNGEWTVVIDQMPDGVGAGVIEPTDAEFIAHARTDVPALVTALEVVLGIHEPINAVDYGASVRGSRYTQVCTGCGQDDGNWSYWPCPTVQAIADALGQESGVSTTGDES